MAKQEIFTTGQAKVGRYVYVGELRCGVPHGFGRLYDRSGKLMFEGNWTYGFRMGQGVQFALTQDRKKFEGTFVGDKYHRGTFYFNDGYYFEGSFHDNSISRGNIFNSEGQCVFHGRFVDHKKSGFGYEQYEGGVIEAYWMDDKIEKIYRIHQGNIEDILREAEEDFEDFLDDFEEEDFEEEDVNGVEWATFSAQQREPWIDLNEAVHLDPILKKCLGFHEEQQITHAELQQVTSLDPFLGSHKKIESLAGLEHAVNIQFIDLSYMLSKAIYELPDLRRLKNLDFLVLSNTNISELTNIALLPNLRNLILRNTFVTDVRPLAKIKSLEHVTLPLQWISSDDLEYLVRENPNLKIRDYKES